MKIRTATRLDRDDIHRVHCSAFAESERELVARLAVNLLSEGSTPETISLLAEIDDAVVGHIAFSPVTIDGDDNTQGYILAPLGVAPGYQKRRIGTGLIESGMRQLSGMGVDIVLVYGDPDYYGRFGFSPGVAEAYVPPYPLAYPFGWQGIALGRERGEKPPMQIACVTSLCDPALW